MFPALFLMPNCRRIPEEFWAEFGVRRAAESSFAAAMHACALHQSRALLHCETIAAGWRWMLTGV
jgi:hypothetical protein